MNKRKLYKILGIILFLFIGVISLNAQPGGPPPYTAVAASPEPPPGSGGEPMGLPLDGGTLFLIIAGVLIIAISYFKKFSKISLNEKI